MAEQILAGRHWSRIKIRECGLQRVVERITRLFEPEQRVFAQRLGVGNGGLKIKAAIGINRESRVVANLLQVRIRFVGSPRPDRLRRFSSFTTR